MDDFHERLIVRAATIDELLSGDFESLPGQKGDTDMAARRLAAWCRSSASGDWRQFGRRLDRDGWDFAHVLTRFASVRRKPSATVPAWIDDAIWIDAALRGRSGEVRPTATADPGEPHAFQHLFAPVVEQAEARLWSAVDARAVGNLNDAARASLGHSLSRELSALCAPAIYALFDVARKSAATSHERAKPEKDGGVSHYDRFVEDMKAGGFRRLFDAKPVLLRLIATITRQWIDTTRELVLRLDADLPAIHHELLRSTAAGRVVKIEGELADPHNGGRSVRVVVFENGSRIVYKPKDLRVDAAWHALVDRLNHAAPPLELRAVRTLSRGDYGWTEFIDHAASADRLGCARYFRRAGAWLALLHCFAATDVHQENLIAAGEHPVPIDIETILQAAVEEPAILDAESQAYHAALEIIASSVMMVGLIPSYERSSDNRIVAIGGLTSDWNVKTGIRWNDINTDAMRPARSSEAGKTTPNLPHVGGRYVRFADHFDDFIRGFEDYARFLVRWSAQATTGGLFAGFAGLPVRKVVRPTRFYYMLRQRLRDHRAMGDGVVWSAQADFVARLADWAKDADPQWPLLRSERSALVALDVPHFVMSSDGTEIRDATGVSVRTEGVSGLDRAAARVRDLDEERIDWQVTVIRQNIASVPGSAGSPATVVRLDPAPRPDADVGSPGEIFVKEADRVAAELSRCAVRRGPGAAWIGLDWLGDSEVSQLVCLGPDLYNGVSGIALFLAAHAAVTRCGSSGDLALCGVAHLRKELKSRNAARVARSLGVGGGAGLGSIVYALSVMSACLRDGGLLADAHAAAALVTDDLIAADKQLNVIGGSAGAILGLLRLYRDGGSRDVLARATQCGEHLLRQPRVGVEGRRSWSGGGSGPQDLNGMSHGAAGYAYALASLSAATGREEFALAASECIAFENASYDVQRHAWPNLRDDGELGWPCQWCHGAPGIGLARIGMARLARPDTTHLTTDILNAVAAVEHGWPGQNVDTLCCGTLGSVELLSEAAAALGRTDLRDLASRRLTSVLSSATASGDYRWSGGNSRFNLGMFRGLAGIGYTALRRVDGSLPNVLIWE